jgi:hypothetical protein
MASWTEKLEQAKAKAEQAREAEKRQDWVDALACWDEAHALSMGNDFRDECRTNMERVRQLAKTAPRRKAE